MKKPATTQPELTEAFNQLDKISAPPTDIILLVEIDAGIIIRDAAKWDKLRERIKADIVGQPTATDTAKQRDEIRALAGKVTRCKTAVDKARKAMTEEYRLKTAETNKVGNGIVAELEGLQELARRPLTEWEAAEEQRKITVGAYFQGMRDIVRVDMGEATIAGWEFALQAVKDNVPTPEVFLERYEEALNQKAVTLSKVEEALANAKADEMRREQQKQQDEEIALLRKDKADREFADSILAHIGEARRGFMYGKPESFALIERELSQKVDANEVAPAYRRGVELARIEALEFVRHANEKDTLKREADAKAETDRLAAEAAAKAVHDAESKLKQAAIEALDRQERAHKAQLAEIEAKAEAKRKEDADKAEADEARQKDKAHKGRVMGEAKAALIAACDIDEAVAKSVVLAIAGGQIPHVKISF